MQLADFTCLALRCRDEGYGLAEFSRDPSVLELQWPEDVLEQWVYDQAGNDSFLRDYEGVDLSRIDWLVEALPLDLFMVIPTGPSDADAIEYFAQDPDHWVAVRNSGPHLGVQLSWDVHGTWKRWPIVLDASLIPTSGHDLQLVEGRTRVGILRGRQRQGKHAAHMHLAWVGRERV